MQAEGAARVADVDQVFLIEDVLAQHIGAPAAAGGVIGDAEVRDAVGVLVFFHDRAVRIHFRRADEAAIAVSCIVEAVVVFEEVLAFPDIARDDRDIAMLAERHGDVGSQREAVLRAEAELVPGELQRVAVVILVIIFGVGKGIGRQQADIVGHQGLAIEFEAILGGVAGILCHEHAVDRIEACGLEILILTVVDGACHLQAVIEEAAKETGLDIVQLFRVDQAEICARGRQRFRAAAAAVGDPGVHIVRYAIGGVEAPGEGAVGVFRCLDDGADRAGIDQEARCKGHAVQRAAKGRVAPQQFAVCGGGQLVDRIADAAGQGQAVGRVIGHVGEQIVAGAAVRCVGTLRMRRVERQVNERHVGRRNAGAGLCCVLLQDVGCGILQRRFEAAEICGARNTRQGEDAKHLIHAARGRGDLRREQGLRIGFVRREGQRIIGFIIEIVGTQKGCQAPAIVIVEAKFLIERVALAGLIELQQVKGCPVGIPGFI